MIEPKIGQLWVPRNKSYGNVRSKRVTSVGINGAVYARSEPAMFDKTLPNHYTRDRWEKWVADNDAAVVNEAELASFDEKNLIGERRTWSGQTVEAVAQLPGWVIALQIKVSPAAKPFSISYVNWSILPLVESDSDKSDTEEK